MHLCAYLNVWCIQTCKHQAVANAPSSTMILKYGPAARIHSAAQQTLGCDRQEIEWKSWNPRAPSEQRITFTMGMIPPSRLFTVWRYQSGNWMKVTDHLEIWTSISGPWLQANGHHCMIIIHQSWPICHASCDLQCIRYILTLFQDQLGCAPHTLQLGNMAVGGPQLVGYHGYIPVVNPAIRQAHCLASDSRVFASTCPVQLGMAPPTK